jgi:hypothetical protein
LTFLSAMIKFKKSPVITRARKKFPLSRNIKPFTDHWIIIHVRTFQNGENSFDCFFVNFFLYSSVVYLYCYHSKAICYLVLHNTRTEHTHEVESRLRAAFYFIYYQLFFYCRAINAIILVFIDFNLILLLLVFFCCHNFIFIA